MLTLVCPNKSSASSSTSSKNRPGTDESQFLYFSGLSSPMKTVRGDSCRNVKHKDNNNNNNHSPRKRFNYFSNTNNHSGTNSKSVHVYKNPLIKYDEQFYEKNSSYLKDYFSTIQKIVNSSSNASSPTLSPKSNLPDGVQLTLSELREMACHQQTQIETQQRLLAAKEQRLRYLREQDAKQQNVLIESEKLRRLRERVEGQELKLRKLRALRGQVDHNKQNNITLTSDLESIRALFNEKEKELSMAVAKVEELTKQLEELRRGRISKDQTTSAAAQELEKLRRELAYRNKLNEQQNVRLNQQREALTARQEEMISIDERISELQTRLQRKRLANQQLASQISNTTLQKQKQTQDLTLRGNQQVTTMPPRGNNIAAVEPYNHIPNTVTLEKNSNNNLIENKQNVYFQQKLQINKSTPNCTPSPQQQQQQQQQPSNEENDETLPEFNANKYDAKYQTLPYNTKFTLNLLSGENSDKGADVVDSAEKHTPVPHHYFAMTKVHSTPMTDISKNVSQEGAQSRNQKMLKLISLQNVQNNINGYCDAVINTNILQSNNGLLISSSSSSPHNLHQKPVNSVAPTSVQHPSNLFYTPLIKVQPVQPHVHQHQHQDQQKQIKTITTLTNTLALNSENSINDDEIRPQLPPKPIIKPPPRQTQPFNQCTEFDDVAKDNTGHVIKAKPLMLKKLAMLDQPKLKTLSKLTNGVHVSINRRIDIPTAFYLNNKDTSDHDTNLLAKLKNDFKTSPTSSDSSTTDNSSSTIDEVDKAHVPNPNSIMSDSSSDSNENFSSSKTKKGNLKQNGKCNLTRRVSFDPLALLLDASLEGELELVKKTAAQVTNPSAANDEGITALHNAICAGHLEIVKFLIEFGCDVNAQDSDGWTPLHCAASCNNVAMVKFLVEHGACIFATTLSDHETAAEKCEEDEEGFDGCSEYLYSVQEKLGILNTGTVYAVFDYTAQHPDELNFTTGNHLTILRKGDENEREWWWARLNDSEGYVPRNLLGLYPRVITI